LPKVLADQAVPILVAAILVNIGVMALVVVPPLVGRTPAPEPSAGGGDAAARAIDAATVVGGLLWDDRPGGGPAAYDRVVRVVAWAFLAATAIAVVASGLWLDTQNAILGLIVSAAAFVVIVHELAPPEAFGRAKYILEGTVAIAFAAVLVYLTGGQASPFAIAFPLIVGGAALVVERRLLLVLALLGAAGYVIAGVGGGADSATSALGIATIAIQLTALFLFAYAGSVIGREQRRSRDAAIRLSTLDTMTGLFNRAFLGAALEREIARSARSGRAFCLLMLDLDDLKAINDRHGHHVGDAVIRLVAETLRDGVRKIDVPVRYGGDEFVALLPETDPTGGWVVGEKIRQAIGTRVLPGLSIRISVSVGIVAYPVDGTSSSTLLVAADRAMYAAKGGGKNRVSSAAAGAEADASRPAGAGRGSYAGSDRTTV
jgi:diguanylate cyclase (GGDEF)-like protein